MATTDEIAERLQSYARGYAFGRGYVLGEGADTDLLAALKSNIESGAGLFAGVPESGIEAAQDGLVNFVDAMISARRIVYADNVDRLSSNIIGEGTFAWAKSKLCPIFPVC